MWPFRTKTNPEAGEDLAKKLYHNVVGGWESDSQVKVFRSRLPDAVQPAFADKYLIYCEANVLRVLITQQTQGRNLLHAFERVLFGTEQSKASEDKLAAVKVAMLDLNKLVSEKKEMSWSRQWLLEIGHDETNPAQLFLLAHLFGTKHLRQLVTDLNKITR